MTESNSGPGWGRWISTDVPGTFETPEVSAGMVFWCFVMGGQTEWSITSGGTTVVHQSGKSPISGSFLHGGGTITFQVLSGSPARYSLGWGSMVDDTDPAHFKIVPAVPPDAAVQGAATADLDAQGDHIQPQPNNYGSPNLNQIHGPDSNTQSPSSGGGLNQDGSGTYWGGWVVQDSQTPATGAHELAPDQTKLGAGYMNAYESAQAHLLIIPPNPWPQTSTHYEGRPWGTYDEGDERTDLIQAHYDDEQSPIPTTYEVLEQGIVSGQNVTLNNSLDITQNAQGNTDIWYVSRQGLVRGTATQYQYWGFPMQKGALRLRTASGWKTIGNARFSMAQAGWSPANPNTGGGPDDPNGYDYPDAYVGAMKILVAPPTAGSPGATEVDVDVYSMGLTCGPDGPAPASDYITVVPNYPYGMSTKDVIMMGQGNSAPYPGGSLTAEALIDNAADVTLGFSMNWGWSMPVASADINIKLNIDGTDVWAGDLTSPSYWGNYSVPLAAGSHVVRWTFTFPAEYNSPVGSIFLTNIVLYPLNGGGGTPASGAQWVTEQPAYWGTGTPLYLRTELGWEMVALFGSPAGVT